MMEKKNERDIDQSRDITGLCCQQVSYPDFYYFAIFSIFTTTAIQNGIEKFH